MDKKNLKLKGYSIKGPINTRKEVFEELILAYRGREKNYHFRGDGKPAFASRY
jgi:hypothetical protein